MTDNKHTPGKAFISSEDFGSCRIVVDGERQQRLCSMYVDFSPEESKANAARIVTTWNEYDTLKAELEAAKQREAKLREALERIKNTYDNVEDLAGVIAKEALNQ